MKKIAFYIKYFILFLVEKNFFCSSLMALVLSGPTLAKETPPENTIPGLIEQAVDEMSCQITGFLKLQTQRVVNNGTVVSPDPPVQGLLGPSCNNGSYANIWVNYNTGSKEITEIDYTLGKKFTLPNGDIINFSFGYFDIQAPELFKFNKNNILNFNANYRYENCALNFNTKVTALGDGYSVSGNCDFPITDDFNFSPKIGYYKGPIGASEIVLWTQKATLEVMENINLWIQVNTPVYQHSGDKRGSSMVGGFQFSF